MAASVTRDELGNYCSERESLTLCTGDASAGAAPTTTYVGVRGPHDRSREHRRQWGGSSSDLQVSKSPWGFNGSAPAVALVRSAARWPDACPPTHSVAMRSGSPPPAPRKGHANAQRRTLDAHAPSQRTCGYARKPTATTCGWVPSLTWRRTSPRFSRYSWHS